MNEFEDLLNSVSEVTPGDVVTAEVLTVDAGQANVAIAGTGVEGVLTLRELTNDRNADINDLVKVGETLELLVLRQVVGKDTDTVTYLVSKKRLEARKAWDKLVGREEEVVTVKGTRAVKGGLSVEFEGLRGFIPASMILPQRFIPFEESEANLETPLLLMKERQKYRVVHGEKRLQPSPDELGYPCILFSRNDGVTWQLFREIVETLPQPIRAETLYAQTQKLLSER